MCCVKFFYRLDTSCCELKHVCEGPYIDLDGDDLIRIACV